MATRGARDLDRPAALKSVGTTLARPRPIKPNPPTASAGRPTSNVAVKPRAARVPPLRNSCVAPRRLVSPCWRPENEVTIIPEMAAVGRQPERSPRRVGRERLRPDIAPGTLHAVRAWETKKNWAE